MLKIGYKNFLLVVLILLSRKYPGFSQEIPQIINPPATPIVYCTDSVFIAPEITVRNFIFDEQNEGMKISVMNYRVDEDILHYIPINGLNYYWNQTIGVLEIRGTGTDKDYENAIRQIYYKNLSNSPVTSSKTFVITLLDADYLPKTGHFYKYIKDLYITWTDAKTAADTMKYYGLQGYLATVLSEEENSFIWTKLDGIGWIGASDEETDGIWKWVTGPEQGQQFWQGDGNGSPVNDMFSSWADGEPNNAYGGQQYAHFNQHPEHAPKSWNDLKNDGSDSDPQYYTPQGYVVEFGGMPGDPEVKLSATIEVGIKKISFLENTYFEICKGESLQLNVSTSDLYDFTWSPDSNISHTNISNPIVNPNITTTYKVIAQLDDCVDSLLITVKVNPVPEINFSIEDNNEGCPPLDIRFSAGDSDINDSIEYLWDFGDGNTGRGRNVINYYEAANSTFDVRLVIHSLLSGCSDSLFLPEIITTYPVPVARFYAEPAIVYMSNPVIQFNNESENAVDYDWDFGDGSPLLNLENPEHRFSKMGKFLVRLYAFNELGCANVEEEQIIVGFEKVYPPTAFSPNANLPEDRQFRIYAEGIAEEGYNLQIFNRWGEKIFTSNSPFTGWNGKMKNGQLAPAGTYTWIIEFTDFMGKSHQQQGNVILLF